MVDDDDYREGFVQGFRAICGSSRALPTVPARPATPAGKTPFQVGMLKGIQKGCARKGLPDPILK